MVAKMSSATSATSAAPSDAAADARNAGARREVTDRGARRETRAEARDARRGATAARDDNAVVVAAKARLDDIGEGRASDRSARGSTAEGDVVLTANWNCRFCVFPRALA